MISVRVTYAERKKLMELKVQRGCQNMSQVIRMMLGFPRSAGDEPFEGADDIDGVSKLCTLVVRMVDRQDVANRLLARMAEKQGIKDVDHQKVAVLDAPLEPIEPFEFRNGHQHPALPEGFKRA